MTKPQPEVAGVEWTLTFRGPPQEAGPGATGRTLADHYDLLHPVEWFE